MNSNIIPSTPYTPSHPAASGKPAGALVQANAPGGVSTDLTSGNLTTSISRR